MTVVDREDASSDSADWTPRAGGLVRDGVRVTAGTATASTPVSRSHSACTRAAAAISRSRRRPVTVASLDPKARSPTAAPRRAFQVVGATPGE
jgi:hypothetical protein